jgi:hypothetical protein
MAVLTLSGAAALSAPACGGNTAPHTTGGGDSGNGDDGMQMVMEGGVTDDGGSDAAPGAPITAPNETWTWVPFDDARCMNDTPTGLGVNITNKSDKLAIFLMGGGACWDSLTVALGTCANLSGYGDANFMSDIGKYGTAGMFDRSDPDNPFKDYSFVFAPYCSGDVFSGSNPKAADGEKHVGYDNVTAYLKRIVPTFPHPSILALTGSSAGGLGVMMNMPQVSSWGRPTSRRACRRRPTRRGSSASTSRPTARRSRWARCTRSTGAWRRSTRRFASASTARRATARCGASTATASTRRGRCRWRCTRRASTTSA